MGNAIRSRSRHPKHSNGQVSAEAIATHTPQILYLNITWTSFPSSRQWGREQLGKDHLQQTFCFGFGSDSQVRAFEKHKCKVGATQKLGGQSFA